MARTQYVLLEARVTAIEAKLAALEEQVAAMQVNSSPLKRPLVEVVWGAFADDSDFDKAMELGRKYREAQRPKSTKKKAKTSTKKTQIVKGK